LDICAQLEAHAGIVGCGQASDDRGGAEGRRNAKSPRETVEAANGVTHHVVKQQLGQTFERKAVDARTESLLYGTDRPFDFADVTVGGDNVHFDGTEGFAKAFKFTVGVNVTHYETAYDVKMNSGLQFT
jgi:hypothetical protein